jgi:sulfide:quinone oxidoreductase
MLRVLVAGGGVAALEAVLALRALAGEGVAVTMLAPGDDFAPRAEAVLSPFTGVPAPRVPLERLDVVRRRGALAAIDGHIAITTDGDRIVFDRLIVAPGARAVEAVPGATLFRGPVSAGAVEGALRAASRTAMFALPSGFGWPLPIYELALLAAREFPALDVSVVSPEPRPLDLFGPVGSDALARLLDRAGIGFIGATGVREVIAGALVTASGRLLPADAAIALPRLTGPRIDGLPADASGFIPIDAYARVLGVPDVFAAGDATTEPIKQGGLACQQADAAAQAIAAEAGAPVSPRPFRRVLRGVVLTGEAPLFLRRDLDDDSVVTRPLRGAPPGVSRSQLWWPTGKIAGRYLTGFAAGGEEQLADRPRRHPVTSGRPASG